MPIYEYLCKNCGKKVEILHKSLEEKAVCPECGSEKLEKLISKVFQGKGGNHFTTCCGRDTPCEIPPCADGICKR